MPIQCNLLRLSSNTRPHMASGWSYSTVRFLPKLWREVRVVTWCEIHPVPSLYSSVPYLAPTVPICIFQDFLLILRARNLPMLRLARGDLCYLQLKNSGTIGHYQLIHNYFSQYITRHTVLRTYLIIQCND